MQGTAEERGVDARMNRLRERRRFVAPWGSGRRGAHGHRRSWRGQWPQPDDEKQLAGFAHSAPRTQAWGPRPHPQSRRLGPPCSVTRPRGEWQSHHGTLGWSAASLRPVRCEHSGRSPWRARRWARARSCRPRRHAECSQRPCDSLLASSGGPVAPRSWSPIPTPHTRSVLGTGDRAL